MPWIYDVTGKPKWNPPDYPCVFCRGTGRRLVSVHEGWRGCECPFCRCPMGCPIEPTDGGRDGEA